MKARLFEGGQVTLMMNIRIPHKECKLDANHISKAVHGLWRAQIACRAFSFSCDLSRFQWCQNYLLRIEIYKKAFETTMPSAQERYTRQTTHVL